METIKSWSYSRLVVHETCPRQALLKFVQKLEEPPPKANNPGVRGDSIHKAGELYIKDGAALDAEMEGVFDYFRERLEKLRVLYVEGRVEVEQDWHFDDAWVPTTEKYPWLRVKCDVVVFVDESEAIVIDWKSGKKFGNEMKHLDQTKLYAIAAFMKYPKLQKVTTELWYVDQDEISSYTYTRDQAERMLPRLEARVRLMMEDTVFRPRPSVPNCKYCPYGPRGTGACPVGVGS
jgi:CRISPR/Cas system-associated exonuclease Cas4 (RecB family)